MTESPTYTAFAAGKAAFAAGATEQDCPYAAGEDRTEWIRAYKNARKQARFQATIEARRLEAMINRR